MGVENPSVLPYFKTDTEGCNLLFCLKKAVHWLKIRTIGSRPIKAIPCVKLKVVVVLERTPTTAGISKSLTVEIDKSGA